MRNDCRILFEQLYPGEKWNETSTWSALVRLDARTHGIRMCYSGPKCAENWKNIRSFCCASCDNALWQKEIDQVIGEAMAVHCELMMCSALANMNNRLIWCWVWSLAHTFFKLSFEHCMHSTRLNLNWLWQINILEKRPVTLPTNANTYAPSKECRHKTQATD